MLSKPAFVVFLDLIKKYQDINNEFSTNLEKLLGKTNNEFIVAESYWKHQDDLVELLKVLMGDTENDFGWIEYWVYDCDFGERRPTIKEPGSPVEEIVTVHTIYDQLFKINN